MHDFINGRREVFSGLNLNEMALLLCVSVMLGGLQLCLPWVRLKNIAGWRFEFNADSQELEQIKTLFMVGALGAAVEVNILSLESLPSLQDSGGLSYLLSSRLVELPLGVFAIAIATVFFLKCRRLQMKEIV